MGGMNGEQTREVLERSGTVWDGLGILFDARSCLHERYDV